MAETMKTLNLEEYFPSQLATLSHSISRPMAAVFEQSFAISMPEWRVMAIVARHPGLSAVDVAQRAQMDKVAVSRAINKLVNSSRIDRWFGDADRRRSILNLSESGRDLYEEIAPLALLMESELLEDLTEDEREILRRVIDKLNVKSRVFTKTCLPPSHRLENSNSRATI
jgi:DNA-binding MarR family transcriptional regulator